MVVLLWWCDGVFVVVFLLWWCFCEVLYKSVVEKCCGEVL